MVCVFGGMATGEMVVFQQMGFGLAVAILLDATVVRTIVVPATMELLGDRNWYLPRWLEWLPNVSIEGRRAPEAQSEGQPAGHTPQGQPAEHAPETGKGRSRREREGAGAAHDTRNPAWNPTPATERARTD
jgi:RND superfamily putative drug exporter